MFRVKICGITHFDDAVMALDCGANALGLNFYSGSKRCISEAAARRIVEIIPNDVWRVGVFVNATADQIAATADHVPRLSVAQLHGDEPPELLSQIPGQLTIVRAFRCGDDGLAPLAGYLGECRALGRVPDAVLVDAKSKDPREYGGTGLQADWQRIADDRDMLDGVPLILAGGLTPDNVRAAMEAVRPDGVDVASGVEGRNGRKNSDLVDRFIGEALEAYSRYS